MSSNKVFLTASTIIFISTLLSVDYFRLLSHHSDAEKSSDSEFQHWEVIPVVGAVGPESFAFDPSGDGPYTGVSDGRIIKWQEHERRWIDFAVTSPVRDGCDGSRGTEHICGRPLGLAFDENTGDLYIADAYLGLLVVGGYGGLATKVATQAQGVPFRFTNGLDIHPSNGVVYFTDSSSSYQRRNYMSAIISGEKTGRLMTFNPKTKETTVLLYNLSFPNGVALSQNGDFLLVAETTNCRILKLWLETSKAGRVEVFVQLPGFPDNIRRNQKGEFWVGIHSRRSSLLKRVLSFTWIGNALVNYFPVDITNFDSYAAKLKGSGLAVKLGEDGEILEMIEDKKGKIWKSASEVMERHGYLLIGSVKMPFLVKLKN